MNGLSGRVRARLLLRSLAVQGSWNYETLIGTGFAFTLLPALRHLHREDAKALQASVLRHAELFNSHPYLAPLAAGAVARMEEERVDPHVIERFKSALRGSLGSLGDQLVWWAWRPMAALLGVSLILAGAAWWLGVVAFLVVYNVLHLGLRAWGLNIGARYGLEVGRVVRGAPLQRWGRRAGDVGAVLGGFAFVVAAAPNVGGAAEVAVLLAAVGAGLWLGQRARGMLWGALGLVWIASIVFGLMGGRVH